MQRCEFTFLCVLLLAGCSQSIGSAGPASVAASTSPLSDNELMARVSGKTFDWLRARDQASGQTTFASDGGMTWRRTDVKTGGTGKWWVAGGKLCQKYLATPGWKGGLVCRTLTAVKTNLITSPNDGGRVTFTEVAS